MDPGDKPRDDKGAWAARASHPDLDDRDAWDGAVAEALDVDLELVGVEADGHVELEAGGDDGAGGGDVASSEGDDAGRVIDRVGGDWRLECQ